MNRMGPRVQRILAVFFFFASGACIVNAESNLPLNIMPLPAKAERAEGSLKIDGSFRVSFVGYREPRLERAGQRFLHQVRRQTGIVLLPANTNTGSATLEIKTDHESKVIQELGEHESYWLDETPRGAKLHAPNPLGVFRGLQTVLQCIAISPGGLSRPPGQIRDRPRF